MNTNDKVVCVNDDFQRQIMSGRYRFTGIMPRKGAVYVVEKVMRDDTGSYGYRLTGTTAFITHENGPDREVGYHYTRFRALEEMKSEARLRTEVPELVEVRVDVDPMEV